MAATGAVEVWIDIEVWPRPTGAWRGRDAEVAPPPRAAAAGPAGGERVTAATRERDEIKSGDVR